MRDAVVNSFRGLKFYFLLNKFHFEIKKILALNKIIFNRTYETEIWSRGAEWGKKVIFLQLFS